MSDKLYHLKYVDYDPELTSESDYSSMEEVFFHIAESVIYDLEEVDGEEFDRKEARELIRVIRNKDIDNIVEAVNNYNKGSGVYYELSVVIKDEDAGEDPVLRLNKLKKRLDRVEKKWKQWKED